MADQEHPIVVALKEFFGPLLKITSKLPPVLAYGAAVILAILVISLLGTVVTTQVIWLIGVIFAIALAGFIFLDWSARQKSPRGRRAREQAGAVELRVRVHSTGDTTHGIPGAEVNTSLSGVPPEITNREGDALFKILDTSFLGQKVEVNAKAAGYAARAPISLTLKRQNPVVFLALEPTPGQAPAPGVIAPSTHATTGSVDLSSQIRFYEQIGQSRGEPVICHGDMVRIGRKPGSQLQVSGAGVSWEHGLVIYRQGAFVYQHLSKTSPTRILHRGEETLLKAGDPGEHVLRNQDVLVIGNYRYIVEIDLSSQDDMGYVSTNKKS